MKVALLLFVALAFAAEQGPACANDNGCVESEDTPHCGVVAPEVPRTVWADVGDNWGAVDAIPAVSGTADTVDSATGVFTNGVQPECARDAQAISPKVDWTEKVQESKKCLECLRDSHCGAGEWCVRQKSPLARRGDPGKYATVPQPALGVLSKEFFPSTTEDHGFTHEEYGDEANMVGSCVKKAWPLGEECTFDNVGDYDEGVNDKAFCGLVTKSYDSICADNIPFGETKATIGEPDRPARHWQWIGECHNHRCYECTVGDRTDEMECVSMELDGAGGFWQDTTYANTEATMGLNRSAVGQIQLVALLLLILIAFLACWAVCIKGMCSGRGSGSKASKPASAKSASAKSASAKSASKSAKKASESSEDSTS